MEGVLGGPEGVMLRSNGEDEDEDDRDEDAEGYHNDGR